MGRLLLEPDGRHDVRYDARPDAEQCGEVRQVLPHGEIAIHRRRLRDVTNIAAQRGRPGRRAEHEYLTADVSLHSDDAADQRRLAASAWSEEPHHLPRGDS